MALRMNLSKKTSRSKTVLILSVSSDIGSYLAHQYLSLGYKVIGTFRSSQSVENLRSKAGCYLFNCDIHDAQSLLSFSRKVKKLGLKWEMFISCVGLPTPLQAFFKSDFDQWQHSVAINSLDQLRALHLLYPLRNSKHIADVVFFAGGGSNEAVVKFSAYTIGKMMLTKMCEFLDAENPDLNIFIVGPGWTKTKIHQTILNDPHISKEKLLATKKFMKQGKGTPLEDIFQCIQWLSAQGKNVAGGRNFSVVYDVWKGPQATTLAKKLKADGHMYKLRRHGNEFMKAKGQ